MTRLFLLVLLFGVIHCQLQPTAYNRSRRHDTMLYANGQQSMVWISSPGSQSYQDDKERSKDFDELFTDVVNVFKEANAEKRKFGLENYNAVDLYTPEEYKRIYPFKNCNQYSLDVQIKHRFMKVAASCTLGRKLKDIVVLPDNLKTRLLTYYVDNIKSELIITVPFFKNSVYFDTEKFCLPVDMVPFLR